MAVILTYALAVSPHWWVGKDGALYLALARNLVRGEGYTHAGQPHTLVPPGYPLMLAALMFVGADSFLALNVATGLVGIAAAGVCYLLLRELVHRDWALLLAGVFAMSNELLQRSGETLADVPFTLMLLGGLCLYARGLRIDRPDRRGWEVASLLLVACCWVRMAGLMIVGGAAIGLVISAWRTGRRRALMNLGIVVLGCLATVGAFYWFAEAHADPGAASYVGGLQDYVGRLSPGERLLMPFRRLYEGSRDFSRLLVVQKMPGYLCIPLLVLPVAGAMWRRIRRGDCVGPLTVAFYIGGMCAAMVRIRTRYLLPISPLLVLYFIEGWAWFAVRIRKEHREAARGVAVALAVVMVAFNCVKIVRNIVEKHSEGYAVRQQGGKWRELPAVVDFLRANRPEGGIMIGDLAYGYLADIPAPRNVTIQKPGRNKKDEKHFLCIIDYFSGNKLVSNGYLK